jgi:hypothetical protein
MLGPSRTLQPAQIPSVSGPASSAPPSPPRIRLRIIVAAWRLVGSLHNRGGLHLGCPTTTPGRRIQCVERWTPCLS